jgi:hypothetical protein
MMVVEAGFLSYVVQGSPGASAAMRSPLEGPAMEEDGEAYPKMVESLEPHPQHAGTGGKR